MQFTLPQEIIGMATVKPELKELQRRKAESISEIMHSLSKAFKEGTLRQISEPKRV
ncbi:hypothetical protein SAMN05216597_3338 [Pseudomonas cannabina]|nr:hypothetical protein SAMN05216597_3338 [Pseudomonas cannabina]